MSRDVIYSLGLLSWFIALAIAEAVIARKSARVTIPNSDARYVTNFGLTAFFLTVGSVLPFTDASAASSADILHIGLSNLVPIPWLAILAILLITQTLARYWAHRWLHRNSLLWRIHRVHHADTAVDVSTSLRNHPLELIVTVPVSVCVILAMGAPVSVVAAEQTILLAATIWEHADISLPPRLDQALSAVIFTPRLHRFHHSPERAIHDSNFGTLFSFWDRLFGTLCVNEGRGAVGLGGQVRRPDHFFDQIWSPLQPAQG